MTSINHFKNIFADGSSTGELNSIIILNFQEKIKIIMLLKVKVKRQTLYANLIQLKTHYGAQGKLQESV